MIRRRGQRPEDGESSSDEEDAFSALGQTVKRLRMTADAQNTSTATGPTSSPGGQIEPLVQQKVALPKSITSSMKRHHKPNDDRKAKMDALLQELEAEKEKVTKEPYRFVPDKKGSFVDPSEEHLTTNIFVGNLAPSITEEDLTELFLQFGELYSIKIMWPRTPAERSRKRNTGFVCFMNRADAEEAMEACNESDPFNVGRLLMMRWGKNVKKEVRQGRDGGVAFSSSPNAVEVPEAIGTQRIFDQDPDEISMRTDGFPALIQFQDAKNEIDASRSIKYDPSIHAASAIRVTKPSDSKRMHFISTVASFIAKDGSQLERKLIEEEGDHPNYAFLQYGSSTDAHREEHIFYRWRVYSFCQGDTYSNWRTEPFVMFHPNGRFWIPPPVDREASSAERALEMEKNDDLRRQKGNRTEASQGRKELTTGRQIERARSGRRNRNWDTGMKLSTEDRDRFNWLVNKKLTISREAICTAMAFCFEKSYAAQDIAALLKDALIDNAAHVTVDMRISRLYLLSDILFNSQQPGVRNAFIYRDAIEKMAPEIFRSLGQHGSRKVGRMTMHKLRTAVSTVLGAWTEWSVYNPAFLDELEVRFSGKEIRTENDETQTDHTEGDNDAKEIPKPKEEFNLVITKARGGWTEVASSDEEFENDRDDGSETRKSNVDDVDFNSVAMGEIGEAHMKRSENRMYYRTHNANLDGQPLDMGENLDGEEIEGGDENNLDGEALEDDDNLDGEATENEDDLDGEALDEGDGDLDGGPLDSIHLHRSPNAPVPNEDLDGAPLDEDIDGEELVDEMDT